MRRFFLISILSGLFCSAASAQEEFTKPKRTGFLFVAPGAITINTTPRQTIMLGAGYEGFLYKGFGLGFDLGVGRQLSESSSGLAGMVTLGAVYDFQRSASQKLCPFVTGGLTALMPNDAGGGYHAGGGIKYWFAKHAGLRMDVRFHARPGRLRTYQDVQARIGIAFR